MSTVTVRLRVHPDREAEFLRIFREVAHIVETAEPDCTIYAVWQTQTPHEYLLVESYRTEAGRTHHNTRHAGVFHAFISCLSEPPITETLGAQVLGIPR
jgi:quinol monooxygenase YgiN